MSGDFLLSAVGDVVAYHGNGDRAFEHTHGVLADSDLVFAQNERHISDATPPETGDMIELAPVRHAAGIGKAGIDVVSFASNHAMDFGPEFMLETAGHLRDLGLEVIGVGRTSEEARRPAMFERNGVKIGFLAYCSVLRTDQEATPARAGVAPMRARTEYHQVDYQPGTPPDILTYADRDDLEAAVEDVRRMRDQVDVVAVSLHWGLHFSRDALAMYQRETAHRLVDEGVDVILGHHPHEIKAVEVYRDRPIFYSLGNFAFDQPQSVIRHAMAKSEFVRRKTIDWNFVMDDPAWTDYSFPENCRYSMIARLRCSAGGVVRTALLPVLINGSAQPAVIPPGDHRMDEYVSYLSEISDSQGIRTRYTIEGDEVVVTAA